MICRLQHNLLNSMDSSLANNLLYRKKRYIVNLFIHPKISVKSGDIGQRIDPETRAKRIE